MQSQNCLLTVLTYLYGTLHLLLVFQVVSALGASDIDARLEELLIDGILYAFQEQAGEDSYVMLNGFGTVVNALGKRAKPYLPQICGTIKWRLNNKAAKVCWPSVASCSEASWCYQAMY